MKKLLLISLLISSVHILRAQSAGQWEEYWEELILKNPERTAEYEVLYEELQQLFSNPVDLNHSDHSELMLIPFLNEDNCDELISYRTKTGPLLTLFELKLIPGFDPDLIQNILPFVVVRMPGQSLISRKEAYLMYRTDLNIPLSRGYDSVFSGSPERHLLRFRYKISNRYAVAFTSEKDPGEPLTIGESWQHPAMDFMSGYLMLENRGFLKKIVVGDYRLSWGQGLINGTGMMAGKNPEGITSGGLGKGLLPYASAAETGFFRGIAGEFKYRHWQLTGLFSHRLLDGEIIPGVNGFSVRSIQTTGLHRTITERNRMDTFSESVAGGRISFSKRSMIFGLSLMNTSFSNSLQPAEKPYKHFDFRGEENTVLGSDFDLTQKNLRVFAEAGYSLHQGGGLVAGGLFNLTPALQTSWIYRNYSPKFHSHYGSAFRENSRLANEEGFYWGAKWLVLPGVTISGYLDRFYFPSLKYLVDAPSDGMEFLLKIIYQLRDSWNVQLLWSKEDKLKNTVDPVEPLPALQPIIRNRMALRLQSDPLKVIKFKTTIQYSETATNQISSGMMISQDLEYRKKKLTLAGRVSIFDTEDYHNRQYIYERDVLYAFSIPAYQDFGLRRYLMLVWKATDNLQFWLRWADTFYFEKNSIGSGNDLIAGSEKNSIKFQLKVDF